MRFAALALVAGLACAGPALADRIDDIVAAELKRQHIPGAAVAVVRNGAIVVERGYGLANVEHGVRVTPKTVFQSGSIGKIFTAALTLLLVEDGKLQLDDPIAIHLPETPPAWAAVTVRHLLNHTAGLPKEDPSIDLQKNYPEDALLREIVKLPLASAPGARWVYSDVGYQLLGILCSRVGGKFYGDQLRDRVFAPAGMGSSRVISEQAIVPHRAAGYDRHDGVLTNQSWVSPTLNTTGDGSLYLSARDLARWSIALDRGKVLVPAVQAASWTPTALNDGSRVDYGFGWEIGSNNGHRFVFHDGEWQGFTAHFRRFVSDRLTVVVLANRSRAQPGRMAENIAAHYLPRLKTLAASAPKAAAFTAEPMYLRGSMNDWGTRDRLQPTGRAVYEARITLDAGTHAFKVGSHDWSVIDFGARPDEAATHVDKTKPVEFKGQNLQVVAARRAAYLFRLDVNDPRTPQLTVRAVADGTTP